MTDFGQQSVYYAHAGAGDSIYAPLLDLDKEEDRIALRKSHKPLQHWSSNTKDRLVVNMEMAACALRFSRKW